MLRCRAAEQKKTRSGTRHANVQQIVGLIGTPRIDIGEDHSSSLKSLEGMNGAPGYILGTCVLKIVDRPIRKADNAGQRPRFEAARRQDDDVIRLVTLAPQCEADL